MLWVLKSRLNQMVLLSTQGICLKLWVRKYSNFYLTCGKGSFFLGICFLGSFPIIRSSYWEEKGCKSHRFHILVHFTRLYPFKWASKRQLSLSTGFPTKRVRLAKKVDISLVASLDMILSNKRITKALISLRRCVDWSAPLLFANPWTGFLSSGPKYQSLTKPREWNCVVDNHFNLTSEVLLLIASTGSRGSD